jgi:hypothetical protein
MAKDKEMKVEAVDHSVDREIPVVVPALPVKRFTFEQWAAQAGVKDQHKSGLRAFCKNTDKLRTIEDWYIIFENY